MTSSTSPLARASEAGRQLRELVGPPPRVAVILGSGLGAFADELGAARAVDYEAISGFPSVAVAGHAGRLVAGDLRGRDDDVAVAVLAGRVHLYEGHCIADVVHPIRALAQWGVKALLLTNSAGGINPAFHPGDLMVITDHLNLTGGNPLVGPNEAGLGARFPDMTTAYDPALCAALDEAAADEGIDDIRHGVYCGLMGPSYETPAEIRMLSALGGDAVGMSTVNEVIAAVHCGMRACGLCCITNLAAGLGTEALSHDEVKEVASRASASFVGLLRAAIPRITRATEVQE